MKKTLKKLGVLAFALVLTMMFVACAQPTDEEGSSVKAPTIIRLILDRDDVGPGIAGAFQIRAGEELYFPVGFFAGYPYGEAVWKYLNADGSLGNAIEAGEKWDTQPVADADRRGTQTWLVPAGRLTATQSIIAPDNPKKKYLLSGAITLKAPVGATVTPGGNTIQVDPKGAYYVDIELINSTYGVKERGSVFDGSVSAFLELDVTTAIGAGAAAFPTGTYMYTKDKHGFNDYAGKDADGRPRYKVKNANIKRVSLKSGINEIYLSYFSRNQHGN
jgi:hypothetical protein